MKEKFIARVPEHIIAQPANPPRAGWTASFNVACWVRLLQPRPCTVHLLLKYIDQEGPKSVIADRCATELSSTLLLSDLARLPVVGKLLDLGVYLETTDNCPPYVIDELYVQNTDKAIQDRNAPRSSKLISAA